MIDQNQTVDGTIPFSETAYSKLTHSIFPTIRRRDKYGSVGDINNVEHGPKRDREVIGKAEIVAKEKRTLDELGDQFLMFDTESKSWDEAYESLNQFYQNLIEPDEELTIYWHKWTERYDG